MSNSFLVSLTACPRIFTSRRNGSRNRSLYSIHGSSFPKYICSMCSSLRRTALIIDKISVGSTGHSTQASAPRSSITARLVLLPNEDVKIIYGGGWINAFAISSSTNLAVSISRSIHRNAGVWAANCRNAMGISFTNSAVTAFRANKLCTSSDWLIRKEMISMSCFTYGLSSQ